MQLYVFSNESCENNTLTLCLEVGATHFLVYNRGLFRRTPHTLDGMQLN